MNAQSKSSRRQARRLMLEADLIGAEAHGVFRLLTVNKIAVAVVLVDGENGMDDLVVSRVAKFLVEMARECGIAESAAGCRATPADVTGAGPKTAG